MELEADTNTKSRKGRLPERILGRTGIRLPRLGFGGLGVISRYLRKHQDYTDLIGACLEAGITFFDTARSYDDSEERIGNALGELAPRFPLFIASKTMRRDAAGAFTDVRRSLEVLGRESLFLYQVHHIQWQEELDMILSSGGALEGLRKARREGLVRYIGVTAHRPSIILKAIGTGLFDTVQIPVNPLDMPLFESPIAHARKLGLGIIAMKPLAGGVLPDAGLALRYALSHPVDLVIPGMSSIEEVNANAASVLYGAPLNGREIGLFEDQIVQAGRHFCRRCGYCMRDCPAGLDIVEILKLERYLTIYKSGHWAKASYGETTPDVASCRDCGTCEEICPYDLPVRSMLRKAHGLLSEPVSEQDRAYHECREIRG